MCQIKDRSTRGVSGWIGGAQLVSCGSPAGVVQARVDSQTPAYLRIAEAGVKRRAALVESAAGLV